ncbi:glycerate kinase family protein [Limosilactobacillus caecicola]|uniref:glycerate kinase family protein n=1 Tax=Limosilactobacillus caecicola TaxID=2941332 RepID=UPI00204119AF|nr:glycerate kinase [Limosilactobacillus caecicola]
MKFVIAPDSFKGSLTAKEVAEAIRTGLQRVFPEADYEMVPMADGGEGTVQSLVDATDGHLVKKQVHNPLNQLCEAYYGILGDGKTAVIEMAQASGIQYVNEQTHNPLITTTYGTGELMLDALDHHVEKIILGIGGSATNDGGAGMAQALGAKLLDASDQEVSFGGGALDHLDHIDVSDIDPRIKTTQVLIASDVTNPLTGKDGASAVFGPQKGATPEMVQTLDQNLHHYAEVIKRDLHKDLEMQPGAGAAGGLGTGLMAFTNSEMARGIDLVVEFTHLKDRAQQASFVFTGEGGIDFQTKFGKTPYGVALATKAVAPQAPVIVLAGNVGQGIDELYGRDAMDAIFATPEGAKPLAKAIADGPHDIAETAENVGRLIRDLAH